MKSQNPSHSLQSELQDRFLTIGKLVLLIGVLIAVFVLAAIFTMRWTVRGTVIEVPNLTETTVDVAEQRLQSLDLELAVIGERYDDQVPEGQIMSQEPGPGTNVKSGGKVQVALSAGKRENPVPDLTGNSLRAATFLAEQNGYSVGNISEIFREGEQDSRVISQFPMPGSTDNVSAQIDVLVGREKEHRFIMPNVTGKNLNQALIFFRQQGFEVRKIEYRSLQEVARGTVIRQFPEPGYSVAPDDAINLEVAR